MSEHGDLTYTVELHNEDGALWATIEEVPGIFAAGDTVDELLENLMEAMGQVLSAPGSTVTVRLDTMSPIAPNATEHRSLVLC